MVNVGKAPLVFIVYDDGDIVAPGHLQAGRLC